VQNPTQPPVTITPSRSPTITPSPTPEPPTSTPTFTPTATPDPKVVVQAYLDSIAEILGSEFSIDASGEQVVFSQAAEYEYHAYPPVQLETPKMVEVLAVDGSNAVIKYTDYYEGGTETSLTVPLENERYDDSYHMLAVYDAEGSATYVYRADFNMWVSTEIRTGLGTERGAGILIREDHPEDMEALVAAEEALNTPFDQANNAGFNRFHNATNGIPYIFVELFFNSDHSAPTSHGYFVTKDSRMAEFYGWPVKNPIDNSVLYLHIVHDSRGIYNWSLAMQDDAWYRENGEPQRIFDILSSGKPFYAGIRLSFHPGADEKVVVDQEWDLSEYLFPLNYQRITNGNFDAEFADVFNHSNTLSGVDPTVLQLMMLPAQYYHIGEK
jgi:hypothetical protein